MLKRLGVDDVLILCERNKLCGPITNTVVNFRQGTRSVPPALQALLERNTANKVGTKRHLSLKQESLRTYFAIIKEKNNNICYSLNKEILKLSDWQLNCSLK